MAPVTIALAHQWSDCVGIDAIIGARRKRCIVCLEITAQRQPREHFLQRGLGGKVLMPRHSVCGQCNARLGDADQALQQFSPLAHARVKAGIITKHNKAAIISPLCTEDFSPLAQIAVTKLAYYSLLFCRGFDDIFSSEFDHVRFQINRQQACNVAYTGEISCVYPLLIEHYSSHSDICILGHSFQSML